jgi:hypothetical protein
MLEQVATESEKAGLTMNFSKTKAMTNRQEHTLNVNNQPIDYVQEYIYLGQIIAPKMQTEKEIQRRICNSWARYWSFKEIMKNDSVPMAVKSKLFNTCILPVLTYGCQTWGLTKSLSHRLEVCQHGIERSMLNIKRTDKWRLGKIRKATGVTDVISRAKRLKWRWLGHLIRSNKNKWSQQVTFWYPRDSKRSRGRPVKRWEDDLPKGWCSSARDRDLWRSLEEAYVQGDSPNQKIVINN